jgi:hypothetical protein
MMAAQLSTTCTPATSPLSFATFPSFGEMENSKVVCLGDRPWEALCTPGVCAGGCDMAEDFTQDFAVLVALLSLLCHAAMEPVHHYLAGGGK